MTADQVINTLKYMEYSEDYYDMIKEYYEYDLMNKKHNMMIFQEAVNGSDNNQDTDNKDVVNKKKNKVFIKIKRILKWIWKHTIGALIGVISNYITTQARITKYLVMLGLITKTGKINEEDFENFADVININIGLGMIKNFVDTYLDPSKYPSNESISKCIDKISFANNVTLYIKQDKKVIDPDILVDLIEDFSDQSVSIDKIKNKLDKAINKRKITLSLNSAKKLLPKLKSFSNKNLDNINTSGDASKMLEISTLLRTVCVDTLDCYSKFIKIKKEFNDALNRYIKTDLYKNKKSKAAFDEIEDSHVESTNIDEFFIMNF